MLYWPQEVLTGDRGGPASRAGVASRECKGRIDCVPERRSNTVPAIRICASAREQQELMLRTLVVGARDLGPVLSASAGLQAVAVAVHLEDVDVMGEPVEQRAGEPLGTEHAGPFVEREVRGDEG